MLNFPVLKQSRQSPRQSSAIIYMREDFESKSGKVREEKGEEGKKKHKNTCNKGNARVQTFITRGVRKGLGGREIREQKNGGGERTRGGGEINSGGGEGREEGKRRTPSTLQVAASRLGRSRQEWKMVASVCEGNGRKKRSGVRGKRRERKEE